MPGWRGCGASSVPALGADPRCVTERKNPPGRGTAAPALGHRRGGKVTHSSSLLPMTPFSLSPGPCRGHRGGRAGQRPGAAAIYSNSQNIPTLKYSPAFCLPLRQRRRELPASPVYRSKVHAGSHTTTSLHAGRTQVRACGRLGSAERVGVRPLTPEPAVAWLYPQNSPAPGPGYPLSEQRTAEPFQSPPCPWQLIR